MIAHLVLFFIEVAIQTVFLALALWIISFVAIVPIGLALAFHEGIKWRNLKHIESGAST